jgi:hypothetical protein
MSKKKPEVEKPELSTGQIVRSIPAPLPVCDGEIAEEDVVIWK